MKTIAQTIGIMSFGCLLPLVAQDVPAASAATSKPPNGTADKLYAPGQVFTAENRMAVEKFFDMHKDEPNGWPAGWSKPSPRGMPLTWRMGRLNVGETVSEKNRAHLMAAPAPLVAMVPRVDGIRYYLAGSNLVALNAEYRVADSIHISTIKYSGKDATDEEEATDGDKPMKDPQGRDGQQGLTEEQKENNNPGTSVDTVPRKPDITETPEGRDGKQGK